MAKTRGVMIPHYPRLVKPSDFLNLIFWNKPDYSYIAERLLRMVAEGRVRRENWQEVVESLGVSKNAYYRVLRRLRQFGLVERGEFGEYRISLRFSSNLKRIAEYWEFFAEDLKQKGSE